MESFPWETFKALLERQASSSLAFYKNIESVPMKKHYFNAFNFAFLLGKHTLNSLF